MDVILKDIEKGMKVLNYNGKRTEDIILRGSQRELQRHLHTLENCLEKQYNFKEAYIEASFEADCTEEDIDMWCRSFDKNLALHELSLERCKCKLTDIQEADEKKKSEEKLKHLYEEEKKLDSLRAELKKRSDDGGLEDGMRGAVNRAKLPKLVISSFNGTHIDWFRFWNQFQAEIDRASLAPVTKFSYLKELVNPNVRVLIDGLPFSVEGYERAKNILLTKYGQTSEIVNAHVQSIMQLPTITNSNPGRIQEFYQRLVTNIQALETMGKLRDINGYVRLTLDKLPAIRSDLVRLDDDWKEWDFPRLVDAVRKWTERNPVSDVKRSFEFNKPVKSFSTMQANPSDCIYCEQVGHKPSECKAVPDVAERKKVLSKKKLCFNCAKGGHRANQCKSRGCYKCRSKHHTSICDNMDRTKTPVHQVETSVMCSTNEAITYPVVVVVVNGVKCRALLDTGAGSSYVSSTLIDRVRSRPVRREARKIEMLMHTAARKIDIHQLEVVSVDGEFCLHIEASKVEKKVLLTLTNPNYEERIREFRHLKGITIEDNDAKPELPVHMILGASDYSKIKMEVLPRIGRPGEPIAECTRFGWMLMSPGHELEPRMYLTRSSTDDYDRLCRLDVLGLQDHPEGDQQSVYGEFKEQLERNPQGWYETSLIWKVGHPKLLNNKATSIGRLNNLLGKLKRDPDLFEEYDNKIREQLEQGIVEVAPDQPSGREFYIPHKPVIRRDAESTKLRVVYDASSRPNSQSPSLNECLETGPPLQNLLWSVLTRNRMRPVALTGDMKQAFLQIRIREADRDVLRFHWVKDRQAMEVQVLRFTRALFGLVQSPFLLGATIECHLEACEQDFAETTNEIRKNIYVDDIIAGGHSGEEMQSYKRDVIALFKKAGFELHKWHSNLPSLESTPSPESSAETTYAKQTMESTCSTTSILGLKWDKHCDELAVRIPSKETDATKRGILGHLASIYDPLGLVSPVLLLGKLMFREACELKLGWDMPLPIDLQDKWIRWKKRLPTEFKVPRAIPTCQAPVDRIDIHSFGDASINGSCSVTYAVVFQDGAVSQGILCSNSRLSKKNLTMPRLELIASHMAANTISNVKSALAGLPINQVVAWSDSTTVLHWIRGEGRYRQFVKNRVDKIREKEDIKWRYVSSEENPADIGSRGSNPDKLGELWWKGPSWLADYTKWPADIITTPSEESEAEAKVVKEVLGVAVDVHDDISKILEKHSLWKTLRITSWIRRYVYNCQNKKQKCIRGPLTTEEISKSRVYWIKRTQAAHVNTKVFDEDRGRLNLHQDGDGIYLCHGRVQGDYPIYIPPSSLMSEKLVAHAHLQMLHGGVGYTMTEVRRKYWIPRLRQLTKKVIKACHGCKRFRAIACPPPVSGNLPLDRTKGSRGFQVVGVDYAGPLVYKKGIKQEGKAYILLYSCSLTRAVYLDLMPDQSLQTFIASLKKFIARRGRPSKIYSDNFSTFAAAAKWLKDVMKEEQVHDFLAKRSIRWQFNLSRAPWWGGQFERIIGLVKQSLYKVMGRSTLNWKELESVLLDVEITLNNRPLTYVEDDIESTVLTPNAMLLAEDNFIPQEEVDFIEDDSLKKRAKYLQSCKDRVWRRWTNEYLRSLRERHNQTQKWKKMPLNIGDVVIIRGDERNRAHWKTGIVTKLIPGRDGVVRVVQLRAGKSSLERAVQHLYPLELNCEQVQVTMPIIEPNQRHRRNAAAIADQLIQDQLEDESSIPVVE